MYLYLKRLMQRGSGYFLSKVSRMKWSEDELEAISFYLSDYPPSPTVNEQKSPNYPKSPKFDINLKSPKVSLRSPSQTERIFDFDENEPKTPRSPRKFNYEDESRDTSGKTLHCQ